LTYQQPRDLKTFNRIVRVSTAVILGAGDIGGALARQLAAADLVSRIVIVDERANVAAGKALDVAQSAPVDGYHTQIAGTADLAAVVGAAVILVADTAQPVAEWKDEAGLALVKRAAGLNQRAPIVCTGAAQAAVIEKSVNELGISRMRVFGSAPEALRSSIVAMVGLESNAAPSDISLSVLGRAPANIIVPWDEAAIAGRTATQVLSAAQLARLDGRIARLWPPGPYALASAATRFVQTALMKTPRIHASLVAVSRDEGTPGRSAMMPVTLQPAGIASIVTPSLSTRDRVRFETAMRA
jgi:malate dehydrogenase